MQIKMIPINARRDVASESVPARRMVAEIAPGPAIKRYREREGGDVADVILCDGHLGALLLALVAPLEDHLEGYPEQQQTTGDAESAERNAEKGQDLRTGDGKNRQDDKAMRLDRKRDLAAFLCDSCRVVSARNSGARPGGSIVTMSVTSALRRVS